MKIIKKGELPEEKIYTFDCRRCKSKVEAQQKEGKIQFDQRDGDCVIFKCPVCGENVYVNI